MENTLYPKPVFHRGERTRPIEGVDQDAVAKRGDVEPPSSGRLRVRMAPKITQTSPQTSLQPVRMRSKTYFSLHLCC
jgi:hypothetical protein